MRVIELFRLLETNDVPYCVNFNIIIINIVPKVGIEDELILSVDKSGKLARYQLNYRYVNPIDIESFEFDGKSIKINDDDLCVEPVKLPEDLNMAHRIGMVRFIMNCVDLYTLADEFHPDYDQYRAIVNESIAFNKYCFRESEFKLGSMELLIKDECEWEKSHIIDDCDLE